MAYLTNYTFSKLCREIDIDIEINQAVFLNFIYEDVELYRILNQTEIRYLLKFVLLLRDENEFKLKYYQIVPKKQDNKIYVFEKAGFLKYHLSKECPLLTKDFKDFYIPEDIRNIGDDAISHYRSWFKQNDFAIRFSEGKIDLNTIIMRYNNEFPKTYGIQRLEENFGLLKEIANSRNHFSEHYFDSKAFNKRLIELKDGFHIIFSCPVLRTLSKFNSLLNSDENRINEVLSEVFSPEFVRNYGISNIKNKLLWSKKIKNEILQLLVNYFKWHYKAHQKDFDKLTLEYFGLKCCKSCENLELSKK